MNPILNSGHGTTLFPFMGGIAALVTHNGLEHNTIQYAPDGVGFKITAVSISHMASVNNSGNTGDKAAC